MFVCRFGVGVEVLEVGGWVWGDLDRVDWSRGVWIGIGGSVSVGLDLVLWGRDGGSMVMVVWYL